MQSSHLAQPEGALLPLTATPTMAPTGSVRGKPLTPKQKELLIKLSMEHKIAERFATHTKRFWTRMSDLFTHISGREYSWQSCRRCICAWESANEERLRRLNRGYWDTSDELDGNVVQSPEPYEPSPATGDDVADDLSRNIFLFGSPAGYEAGEDDLLPIPPVPPLRRGQTGPVCDAELASADLSGPFIDKLEAFQSELREFTGAFFEGDQDRREIHLAFEKFREELEKGVRKCGRDGS